MTMLAQRPRNRKPLKAPQHRTHCWDDWLVFASAATLQARNTSVAIPFTGSCIMQRRGADNQVPRFFCRGARRCCKRLRYRLTGECPRRPMCAAPVLSRWSVWCCVVVSFPVWHVVPMQRELWTSGTASRPGGTAVSRHSARASSSMRSLTHWWRVLCTLFVSKPPPAEVSASA